MLRFFFIVIYVHKHEIQKRQPYVSLLHSKENWIIMFSELIMDI